MADASVFYDFGTLLSKQALINMTLSNRGAGKTYGFKKWAIKDFLKTGKQFMYVRRYMTEFKSINTFFDDIRQAFKGVDFDVKGGKRGGQFFINGKVAGYFYPLSSQAALKSSSFPMVNKMCFDEFILEKSSMRYLQDECFAFFNMIETINRLRDTTKLHDLLRVFLFANTITMVNPYFEFFDIQIAESKRFNVYPQYNNDVVVEVYNNTDYVAAKKASRMGAIMDKTPFGRYAIDGAFYADDTSFIEKHPVHAECMVCYRYGSDDVYFWVDRNNGLIYASYKGRGENKYFFTLTAEDHTENYLLMREASRNPYSRILVNAFQNGCMRFDDLSVKQKAIKILQKVGVK